MPWPELVSVEAMKRKVEGITAKVTHVLVGTVEGGAIYARDDEGWRRLDDKPISPPSPNE